MRSSSGMGSRLFSPTTHFSHLSHPILPTSHRFFYFLFEFEKRYDAIDAFYYPREILVEDFDTFKNVHWALQTWARHQVLVTVSRVVGA